MKIKTVAALIAVAASLGATSAQAKQGDVLVRARAIYVMPQDKSDPVLPGLPSDRVKVNDTITPEVDFTYMVTDNIGVEAIAGTSRHTVKGVGPNLGGAKLLETNVLPPTVTVQYHLAPEGKFRPYVGAGLNYSLFFNTDVKPDLLAAAGPTTVKMKRSFGWAAQAGFDIPLNDKMFLNVDVKYIDLDTKATLHTTNLGTQSVKVDINPIIVGVGIGTKF